MVRDCGNTRSKEPALQLRNVTERPTHTRGLFSKIDVSRKTASNTISDPSLPRWWTFVLRTPAYGPWWLPASTSSRRRGVGAVLLFGSGRRGALLRLRHRSRRPHPLRSSAPLNDNWPSPLACSYAPLLRSDGRGPFHPMFSEAFVSLFQFVCSPRFLRNT
jgi:hypothetical protein